MRLSPYKLWRNNEAQACCRETTRLSERGKRGADKGRRQLLAAIIVGITAPTPRPSPNMIRSSVSSETSILPEYDQIVRKLRNLDPVRK